MISDKEKYIYIINLIQSKYNNQTSGLRKLIAWEQMCSRIPYHACI